MKPTSYACPAQSEGSHQWANRLLSGALSEAELEAAETHLDQCMHCERMLAQCSRTEAFSAAVESFLSEVDFDLGERLGGESDDAVLLPSAWQQLLDRLGPTDDPSMFGRLAGYEVKGVVGQGGMGLVLKARDVALDRWVAIKCLLPDLARQSAARRRFSREAQATAAVVHENVIAIHGVDQFNGIAFLVMPYVKGESLQQRIDRQAPLEIEQMLSISLQIARGLSAAHEQGLIHRDIKPANILMPAGVPRVIITDFGLARAADDASLTQSGMLTGTPQYMSPEQSRGEPTDSSTDLFSLGSTMYAMACGHPPFRAETSYGVLRRISDQPHRPLREVRHDLPIWFVEIVDRLLAKQSSDRFPSADSLAQHLEICLAHLRQPDTIDLPRIDRPDRSARRRRVLAVAITSVLLVSGFAADWWFKRSPAPTPSVAPNALVTSNDVMSWNWQPQQLIEVEEELQLLLNEMDHPFAPTESTP